MQDHVAKLFYCVPNNFRSNSSMLLWPISNEKQTFFYKIKEKVRLGKACSVRPGSDIKITLGSKYNILSNFALCLCDFTIKCPSDDLIEG